MSSNSRDASPDCNDLQRTRERQDATSGEGSGSALAAMLKKRREGENHPDDDGADAAGTPDSRQN